MRRIKLYLTGVLSCFFTLLIFVVDPNMPIVIDEESEAEISDHEFNSHDNGKKSRDISSRNLSKTFLFHHDFRNLFWVTG